MTSPLSSNDALRELVVAQSGLATRAQLRSFGIDADRVRNQLKAQRWSDLGSGVIALQTGPLSEQQVAWFAVLAGGDDCVLAGLSALHHQGLVGFPVDRVQTAVPRGRRTRRDEHHVRRTSRRLLPASVHPARRPPMMRLEPALLDALEHMAQPARGCALLAAVVQQRLIPAQRLRSLVVGEQTLPHRELYVAVTGDIEGVAHSLLEIDFRRLARAAGIPAPLGQAVRTDRRGRRRYLDADFGGFGVEVDGAVHLKPLAWWDDMFRLNDILIRHKPMLRFPSVGIRLRPTEVIEQLRLAAARWP